MILFNVTKRKVVNELSKSCHVTNLGYLGNNVLVVNADNCDNFLGDNHKAVLATTVLTTHRSMNLGSE